MLKHYETWQNTHVFAHVGMWDQLSLSLCSARILDNLLVVFIFYVKDVAFTLESGKLNIILNRKRWAVLNTAEHTPSTELAVHKHMNKSESLQLLSYMHLLKKTYS